MHDANPIIPAKARRSGCRWLLIALGVTTALVVSFAVYYSHIAAQARLHNSQSLRHLENSIRNYKIDYNRFPISEDSPTDRDRDLRSRGPMLSALLGKEAGGLNPRKIKFIDMPTAKNRQSGLWKDGEEWVLSDRWGEPYHIILDTNGDGGIANPEYGADQSDPRYARQCKISPPPPTIPAAAIIYSSGTDRDPKTWHDNIASWSFP